MGIKIDLKVGPGREKTAGYCSVCHSFDYITTQPGFANEKWSEIVAKIVKVFGAPIHQEDPRRSPHTLAQHMAKVANKSLEDAMKRQRLSSLFLDLSVTTIAFAAGPPVAPNGIVLIEGYRDWQVIAPSYRPDKGQIRVVLGNSIAIRAFHEGIRPFPDGTIFAKVAWIAAKHPKFPVAEVPATFAQVEFMVKDSGKYKKTGGWGFARFVGENYQPYGKDPGFVKECFGCHTPVADNDFVFTHWAGVP